MVKEFPLVGVFQDSWHSLPKFCSATSSCSFFILTFSEFNETGPAGWQFLTSPDQRNGLICLAFSSTNFLPSKISLSSPLWRCDGVTKFILLCLCLVLYQSANCCTQSLAASILAKPDESHSGRYFKVLNNASEYGLSSLTIGLL
jgi:hypothetical protein